ncbi:ATP-grasp domain-containing protein (plasmid) [Citricoccus nitrophenolicus]
MSHGYAALAVHTDREWLVADLSAANLLPVRQDSPWANEPPRPAEALWCPGAWAARLWASGVRLPLTSAGWQWMPRVAARHPELFAHRPVLAATTSSLDSALAGWDGPVFGKPAEAKIPGFEAALHVDPDAFRRALHEVLEDPSLTGIQLHLSGPIATVREFRCFTEGTSVVAGSFYLDTVQDLTWDAYDTGTAPDPGEAIGFAQTVLDTLAGDHPPGFVLDVAELEDGSWAVVEANASWSSAPYHADPTGVVRSILASQPADLGLSGGRWAWAPDPILLSRSLPLRR